MKAILGLVLTVAGPLTVWSMTATAGADGPEVVYAFPRDGDVLAERPAVLQMCFAAPVNVKDLDKGGDFGFQLRNPGGSLHGMRIVFQPDGYGVTLYPGTAPGDDTEGDWTLGWRITDPESLDPTEGQTVYSVREGGEPVVLPSPDACTAAGGPDGPPAVDEDGGPDVLQLALLTTGVAGAAALVATIGYFIRNRVGFWLHRPPERRNGDGDEHR